ncbi:ATPase, T2SS/T4P/T4SS family [Sodalis endosymbiont of Spalangia cameroni]|uniref:GspE/PulE family protein n=1 Tax=Sodalis praecaptivus TaxID=1239307 RepID=UPI0031F97ABB
MVNRSPADARWPVTGTPLRDDMPVTGTLDLLLERAFCREASDIHIEPYSPAGYRLRLRVDGLMTAAQGCPVVLAEGLVARLKVLARLDIAERRQPQDGQFSAGGDGPPCSLRLSTLPTLHGEKAVLRLLRCTPERLTLKGLGMPRPLRRRVLTVLHQPHGLILVTGPTGSGKTLTLYAMLNRLRRRPLNICSVEDPVELPLAGINQCQVNPRARLDFPLLLRALLRQDPDVLMVGEIRDPETAAVALNAARTGHLVLSTLHTLCADDAVSRLRQLGLEAAQAGPALSLVLAQRLVRQLCPDCRRAPRSEAPRPDAAGYWQAAGCGRCQRGYAGRRGLFALLEEDAGDGHGLWRAGMALAQQGITSLAELRRVLGHPS